jgi:hypothetical protein
MSIAVHGLHDCIEYAYHVAQCIRIPWRSLSGASSWPSRMLDGKGRSEGPICIIHIASRRGAAPSRAARARPRARPSCMRAARKPASAHRKPVPAPDRSETPTRTPSLVRPCPPASAQACTRRRLAACAHLSGGCEGERAVAASAAKGRPSQRSQPTHVAGGRAQAGASIAAHAAAASIPHGRAIEPARVRSLPGSPLSKRLPELPDAARERAPSPRVSIQGVDVPLCTQIVAGVPDVGQRHAVRLQGAFQVTDATTRVRRRGTDHLVHQQQALQAPPRAPNRALVLPVSLPAAVPAVAAIPAGSGRKRLHLCRRSIRTVVHALAVVLTGPPSFTAASFCASRSCMTLESCSIDHSLYTWEIGSCLK